MPFPRVVRSQRAEGDLRSIYNYLAAEASLEVADFVIAGLFEGMRRAAANPLMFQERPDLPGMPRRINVFTYAIFYDPLPNREGIYVLGIIHERRDLPRQLR